MAKRSVLRTGRVAVAAAAIALTAAVVSPVLAQTGHPVDTSARVSAVASARGELNRARTQLQAAVQKVRTTWKANPKYIEALDAVAAARKDYNAARESVVEKLKKDDPTYASMLDTQSDAAARVKKEQDKTNAAAPATTQPEGSAQVVENLPAPSSAQIQAAQDKLNNKTKLRNLEDKAVAADPNAQKAQDKLNEAQKAAKVWQVQLDAALKDDPDYRAAFDQLTSARSRLVSAGATDVDTYDNYGEVYVR